MAFKSIVFTAFALGFASVLFNFYQLLEPIEVPVLEESYWGWGHPKADDTRIIPFRIELGKDILNDIYLRLNLTRPLTPSLDNTQSQYGLSKDLLKDLLNYLKTKYDFKRQEKFLNSVPQYKTEIQGLKVHFIHIKPKIKGKKVLPLMLLHGWPSSVREYYEILDKLTNVTTKDSVYGLELVIPSLPGFGYSEVSLKKEFTVPNMALVLKKLMHRLGHEKFYVHGGDWGAIVGSTIATLFPENILGFHSNLCLSLTYKSFLKMFFGIAFPSLVYPQQHKHMWHPQHLRFIYKEGAYFHSFASKPDTIGAGLDQSIEGLLAYTFEKFSVGTDKNYVNDPMGGIQERLNYDILLDTIMFYYWIPKTATTSARIYAQNVNIDQFSIGLYNIPINKSVPCGCTFFSREFFYQSEFILRDKFVNLIHNTYHEDGGHFIAMEKPQELVDDIVDFIRKTL